MNRFTIFTIILSISVVTVIADVAIHDYFSKRGLANILSASEVSPVFSDEPQKSEADPGDDDIQSNNSQENQQKVVVSQPPPVTPQFAVPVNPLITEPTLRAAGFTGPFRESRFSGKLFQLLDISKSRLESVGQYEVTENNVPAVSVIEMTCPDEIACLELYSLLQNKTKPYIDLSLNETNAYGQRSFYINHSKKKDEAFLVVKIGRRLYGFAYVKFYHPEVKKLIQSLTQ